MKRKSRLLLRELLYMAQQLLADVSAYVPPPLEAALFLTKRCNSRCRMCGYWRNPSPGNELGTDEIRSCLGQLRDLGVEVVSLSGEGELTCRADAEECIRATHAQGFLFAVNSNFLHLPDGVVAAIAETRPYQTTVGIDTLDSSKYERIRGIPDGVKRVRRAIRALQVRGYSDIVLGAVVLTDNLDDLPALVEFAAGEGLRGVRLTAFQPYGFGKKWGAEELRAYSAPDYLARLRSTLDRLCAMGRAGAPILNSETYLRMIPASYSGQFFFPVPCRAPLRRIHLHPDGSVSLCQVMGSSSVVGNIRDSPLDRIWRSRPARNVRKVVRCRRCGGCWLSCYAETNLRLSLRYGLQSLRYSLQRYHGL